MFVKPALLENIANHRLLLLQTEKQDIIDQEMIKEYHVLQVNITLRQVRHQLEIEQIVYKDMLEIYRECLV